MHRASNVLVVLIEEVSPYLSITTMHIVTKAEAVTYALAFPQLLC